SQSIDAISREVVLPVDDILGSAAVLLARVGDADPDAAEHLRRILAAARAVKENLRKVGRDFAAAEAEPVAAPLAGKRVLVVAADERMRRAAHLLLGRLG